jgi:hypothetical protein
MAWARLLSLGEGRRDPQADPANAIPEDQSRGDYFNYIINCNFKKEKWAGAGRRHKWTGSGRHGGGTGTALRSGPKVKTGGERFLILL